jgi:uncharacterized protein YfaS (alpha-2-macroglobulin family)
MKLTKNIITIVLMLLVFTISFSHAKDENREAAKKLYNKAQEAARDKKQSDAIDIYKEIIDKYPKTNYATSSISNLQYQYNSFGKKWLGTMYFNSVIERKEVPESLRAQARMAIAYLKEMHIYSSTQGTYKPKDKVMVNINGRNLDKLDINIYKVDRDYLVENITGLRNILNLGDVKKELVQSFTHDIEKQRNNNYFHDNIEFVLQEAGIYIFEAKSEYLVTKTAVVVTDNILVVKSDSKNTLLWLSNRITGAPVKGAKVIVPSQDSVKEGETDKDGLVTLPIDLKKYSSAIIAAVHGDDIAVSDAYFYRSYQPVMMYFYTDRPIYRPSHKVRFKGVLREIADDEYLLPKNAKADIVIMDPRWKEVKKSTVDLTEYGTFSGEYDVPGEPPLGRYSVQVNYGGYTYHGYFTVQEYKKPEYFVTISPEKGAYIMGDSIKVDTASEYYFGAPVQEADVTWEVYERQYYYPWWRDYRYSWYLSSQKGGYYYGYGRGNIVSSGSLTTDKEGIASFEFDTKKLSYNSVYTIVVKVTDKSRKVVESETTVMVTKGEFRIDVKTNKYSYKEDEDVFVKVTTKDFIGRTISKMLDVEVRRTLRKDKNSKEELFLKRTIKTSQEGKAEFDFKVDKVGRYEVVISATDSRGTKITGTRSVYVYNYSYSYYENTGKGVEITPDKDMYLPGDTANLTISTRFAGSYALITVEQRRLYEYKLVKIDGNSAVIPIKLTDSYKPNMTVTASIVNNNNFLTEQKTIIVLPEDKFLTIDIVPDKEKYKPGEIASFTVRTTDYKGNPVPAEISFALVDESIYALMSEQSINIRQFFYGLQQNWVQTRTSFNFYFWGQTGGAMKEEAKPASMAMDMVAETEGFAARAPMEKGLGGEKKKFRSDKDDSIAFVEAKVREKFKDTAFYRANITTDESGQAGFEVTLPDNLTTWRASVKGVTKDTLVGQESRTILVTKDLLVRLELPRFFTKRDKGTVTGIVHNYLDEAKKVKVILTVAKNSPVPIEVIGDSELIVEVGANEEKRIDWPVDVVRSGEAEITLKALTDEESDAMKLTLPIMPHGIMQHFGDAGVVEDERLITLTIPQDSLNESAKLKLILSPTVANMVTESLEYLIGYPYGCVEQTMSRFLPNIMVSKTLQNLGHEVPKEMENLPDMVKKGLDRLYNFQHSDGGWGWWEQDATHPFMTAYVVYGLTEAKRADFDVAPDVIRRGINSLTSQIKGSDDINVTAYMVYVLANANRIEKKYINKIYDDIDELNNYSLALFAETLYMAGDKDKANAALKRLIKSAESAGGRVFFKSKVRRGHGWYDSDTEATAYALKAIVRIDPKNEIIPKIVLWLANSRTGNRWYNTKDTAAAVMALSEYLKTSDEMEPDYSFSVSVNGEKLGDYRITKDNMFSFDGSILVANPLLRADENKIRIVKKGSGKLYYSAFLKYYSNEEDLREASSGISVEKTILKKVDGKWSEFDGELKVGEEIKVILEINGSKGYEYVIIEDPKPAGCDEVIRSYEKSGSRRNFWWSNVDYRDEKMAVFITRMWQGKYKFEYELTAQTPGEFHVMPAKAYMMYKDEVGGNSDEFTIKVSD